MHRFFKYSLTSIVLILPSLLSANTYKGRVIDQNGNPVSYATVYVRQDPTTGTATDNDGIFSLDAYISNSNTVIVSFLGYEKQEIPLQQFADTSSLHVVVLKEQPIALEETVIAAKPSKQRNKRKQMAEVLYKVYNRMLYDMPDENVRYQVVSDVRMNSENQPWGMEQMIATIVNLPRSGREGRDSIQFAADMCKRFFKKEIRQRANEIYSDSLLNQRMLNAAYAVDSGVVVHQALWALGNVLYDMENTMKDLRHWTISNESETETVLTHTEKHNYFGIFKYEIKRHYIVDSYTYQTHRFSIEGTAKISIPFGYKVKGVYLDMLNLLNMDNNSIEKFRIRRANANVKLNTIYHEVDGQVRPLEKNLTAEALIEGTKKAEIPFNICATQRVTSTLTHDVQPLTAKQMTHRVKRVIVEGNW